MAGVFSATVAAVPEVKVGGAFVGGDVGVGVGVTVPGLPPPQAASDNARTIGSPRGWWILFATERPHNVPTIRQSN